MTVETGAALVAESGILQIEGLPRLNGNMWTASGTDMHCGSALKQTEQQVPPSISIIFFQVLLILLLLFPKAFVKPLKSGMWSAFFFFTTVTTRFAHSA